MKKILNFVLLTVFIITSIASAQQTDKPKPTWEVIKLTDKIYKFSNFSYGYEIKVIASIGKDGILLVDSGVEDVAEDLKKELLKLNSSKPTFVINTHIHGEHIGGNASFAKDGAIIIGHEKMKKRLTTGAALFAGVDEDALPTIEVSDSLSIQFNEEELKIIDYSGGHDETDIIIYFTKSNVAVVAGLSGGLSYPTLDTTGSIVLIDGLVKKVIDRLNENTVIIPSHGKDQNMKEYKKYYKMLVQTKDNVRKNLELGKDIKTMQKEDILKDWSSYGKSFTDNNMWIEYLVDGPGINKNTKKGIYDILFYALKDHGLKEAVSKFKYLRENKQNEYNVDDLTLLNIAYYLYVQKKYEQSLGFTKLCIEEFPKGQYLGTNYGDLGMNYFKLEKYDLAMENYKKALEINPKDSRCLNKIKEIEDMNK